MSQEQLGLLSGLGGQSRIANYEKPGFRNPRVPDIQALARALQVEPGELMGTDFAPNHEVVDVAAALIAICDLLRESVPGAAQDLAARIKAIVGDVDESRLSGQLLAHLGAVVERSEEPKS